MKRVIKLMIILPIVWFMIVATFFMRWLDCDLVLEVLDSLPDWDDGQ